MTKAAELAKMGEVITNNQVGGRRNMLINGAMNVAQRSTSETGLGASAGYFTLDRWKMDFNATAGRLTMSQTADGPSGFANCLKLDCTTADTSIAAGEYIMLEQRLEGQDVQGICKGTADAKPVTVSFYVKANGSFTFGLELSDNDNTRQITKLFATTTSWVRHEITFPADTSGAFDDDNARSLLATFWLHAGSTYSGGTLNSSSWASRTHANRAAGIGSFFSSTDNEFYITGVQMEIGSTATPFEHRSYGDELALCQRYFYRWESSSTYAGVGVGRAYDTSNAVAMINTPCAMRANATLTVSAVGDFAVAGIGGTPASISNGERTTDFRSYKLTINQGSTPFTSGTIYQLESDNQANAKINFDSEL